MPFEWITDPRTVMTTVFNQITHTWRSRTLVITQQTAAEVEAWMKANAAWTDQTGEARRTLFAEVQGLVFQSTILIGYGVDYGFWLEFAHQGRFAIIGPALDHFGPRLFNRIQEEIRKPA